MAGSQAMGRSHPEHTGAQQSGITQKQSSRDWPLLAAGLGVDPTYSPLRTVAAQPQQGTPLEHLALVSRALLSWAQQDAYYIKPLLSRPRGIADLGTKQKYREHDEAEEYVPNKKRQKHQ